MFLADFHVHSTFSDGKNSIPDLIDFYGRRGFGAIAITDHLCETKSILGKASSYLGRTLTPATFPLYHEILKSEAERARALYAMVVIPGIELTKSSLSNHRSAHILALGVTTYLSAEPDITDLCKSIREAGGLSVAAHPVWTRKLEKQTYNIWDRRKDLIECFDAWEVASGPYIFDEIADSSLPKLANSDLHSQRQINSWKTVMDCERHPEAILRAVRKQEIGFHFYTELEANDIATSPVTSLPLALDHRRQHDVVGNLVFA